MQIEFEKLSERYGQVELDGHKLALLQDPYLTGTNDSPRYEAHAIDSSINDFIIYWEIIRVADDESDCCDWNKPSKIRKL